MTLSEAITRDPSPTRARPSYNGKGWAGLGENRGTEAAFLFTWSDGDTGRDPELLNKVVRGRRAPYLSPSASASVPQLLMYGPKCLLVPSRSLVPYLSPSASASVPVRASVRVSVNRRC